jgi:hypothetical protein
MWHNGPELVERSMVAQGISQSYLMDLPSKSVDFPATTIFSTSFGFSAKPFLVVS